MEMATGMGKEPAAPLHGAISLLDSAINTLEDQVAKLGSRLEPILGPSPPKDKKDEPEESGSKITRCIRLDAERIKRIFARIDFLRANLEV